MRSHGDRRLVDRRQAQQVALERGFLEWFTDLSIDQSLERGRLRACHQPFGAIEPMQGNIGGHDRNGELGKRAAIDEDGLESPPKTIGACGLLRTLDEHIFVEKAVVGEGADERQRDLGFLDSALDPLQQRAAQGGQHCLGRRIGDERRFEQRQKQGVCFGVSSGIQQPFIDELADQTPRRRGGGRQGFLVSI
ncbi:MAG: hypothetical protein WDO24_26570 [Pseudomonadota bacterium]